MIIQSGFASRASLGLFQESPRPPPQRPSEGDTWVTALASQRSPEPRAVSCCGSRELRPPSLGVDAEGRPQVVSG